jgi:hypothetical protein
VQTNIASYHFSRPDTAFVWSLDKLYDNKTSLELNIDNETVLSTFICGIPSRLGRDEVFDNAALCLLYGATSLMRGGDGDFLQKCRRVYTRALQSLQEAMTDPIRVKSHGTACAALMFGVYEVRRGYV